MHPTHATVSPVSAGLGEFVFLQFVFWVFRPQEPFNLTEIDKISHGTRV